MAQIAHALQDTHIVLIVGDLPKIKMDQHVGFARAIFLGEFWKELNFQFSERASQILLFEYLRRCSGSLVHLGMRSGTLDSFAIAGHRVVYILDKASENSDDARMGKLLNDKVLLHYRRLALAKAPKLLGQLSRAAGPGLLDGFDLKAELIPVRRTGRALDADPDIRACFDLLNKFLTLSPKTAQYRFFKREVMPNMGPIFEKKTVPEAAPAVELLRDIVARLVEWTQAKIKSSRELDADDLKIVLAEIRRDPASDGD